jgi:hypothetical protein
LQKQKTSIIGVDDLRGDILTRASLFIKNLTGEDITKINLWKELRDYEKIRHCIVHNNGLISQKEKQLLKFATANNMIGESLPFGSVRPEKEISVTYEVCREFIGVIKLFFQQLFDIIGSSHP